MKTVFILNNKVTGIAQLHPDVVATSLDGSVLVEVDDVTKVAIGDSYLNGVFTASAEVNYANIDPVSFYNCFTVTEMLAIKSSPDPIVKEFFAKFQIAYDKNVSINPNLPSVSEGLAYLAGTGAVLTSATRVEQIMRGVQQ